MLSGVGVGDASASPTAALLLTILQESMGRVATILFAHRLGTSLEPECKMFRLLADILNDAAMMLDCLSPAFPKPARVLVLGCSSVLRALCGVAAGSSKASLSAHFAKSNNLAELNAKDSSQETVISLLGMAVGGMVVSWVTSPLATWTSLIVLLSVHLWMNHAAVRAVVMRSLNRQRATIVCAYYVANQIILSPEEVARKEHIFQDGSVIRDCQDRVLGRCKIGIPLIEVLSSIGRPSDSSCNSLRVDERQLTELLSHFEVDGYLLHTVDNPSRMAYIALKTESDAQVQLKAWFSAVQAMHVCASPGLDQTDRMGRDWHLIEQQLVHAGWTDLDAALLETRRGCRISLNA